ncbi:hypothetical protein [Pannonibacter phragmitetus]|uniref:hypothetical protein n=1 Tax=Pannonibacter phragmitetus TaxID=121719 RepID=UPI003D2EBB5F
MRHRSNLKAFALAMALSSTLLSGSAFAADDSIDVAGPFEIKGLTLLFPATSFSPWTWPKLW